VGNVTKDYAAQRQLLADVDAGKITRDELFARGPEMIEERIAGTVKKAG